LTKDTRDLDGIAADERAAYLDMRRRVAGTNINEKTLLATDYLNHFNEIVMLLEIIPDAPECFADTRSWTPKDYPRHFADSSLSEKTLAIEAYGCVPRKYRVPFEEIVDRLDRLIATTLARLERALDASDADAARSLCTEGSRSLQGLVSLASAVIHGDVTALAQAEIDAVLSGD